MGVADHWRILPLALDQRRNADLRILRRDLLDALDVRADDGEGQQHIGEAGVTGRHQLKRGGALAGHDARRDHPPLDIGKLDRLDVRTPATGIAVHEAERRGDIGVHNLRIDGERGREDATRIGEAVWRIGGQQRMVGVDHGQAPR